MSKALSVCCVTADPPARVAYVLGLLQPVSDEIVIAVDSSVDPALLDAFKPVATRIYRFDFRPPVDRPRGWLASRCEGEWIFWIDGDEVPSPALVQRLPELVGARDVLQYWTPRRWLFPDAGHWLEESPWWPDFQIRLVRNDPAVTCYGSTHDPIAWNSPRRLLEEPLYHLSPLVSTIAERRAKCRRYDAERPGMISAVGGPFNETLQIPEQYTTRRPVPVPDVDRPWIARALGAEQDAPTREAAEPVPLADPTEIDAFSADRVFDEGAYRARIAVLERDLRFTPGVTRYLLVRVENHGNAVWPWGPQRPWVRVSYHWRRPEDGEVLTEGTRTLLPETLQPRASANVWMEIAPPSEPGKYLLDIDLVHELVRWFGCSTRVEVQVGDRWSSPPA